uniref:Uncharacterized protein n=1 Tax=viral metagenome TaxID=1070528 RepID=A0A6C0H704_9ZZZZ
MNKEVDNELIDTIICLNNYFETNKICCFNKTNRGEKYKIIITKKEKNNTYYNYKIYANIGGYSNDGKEIYFKKINDLETLAEYLINFENNCRIIKMICQCYDSPHYKIYS